VQQSEQVRVLLIEHDLWTRTDLGTRLEQSGFGVRYASNGFSGLRLAQSTLPDIVVLGEHLPDLSAHDLQSDLGEYPATQRIAVISAVNADRLCTPGRTAST
jgi:DNA-binding response OmpR family regulator